MVLQWMLSGVFTLLQGVFTGMAAVLPSAPTVWTDATTAVTNFWTVVPAPMKYFLPIAPMIVAGAAYFAVSLALGLLALVRRVLLAVIP